MSSLKRFLTANLVLAIIIAIGLVSCTKEGPMGPAGAAGKDGTNGTNGANGTNGLNGKDGKDGALFCTKCHNSEKKNAVMAQFDASLHGSGTSWARGTSKDCAACHSTNGYLETEDTGRDTMAHTGTIVKPMNCDVCHEFHQTLDSTKFPDYALREVGKFKMRINTKMEFNAPKASANTCARCHQARIPSPYPATLAKTDSVSAASSRYGIHYGPQGNIFSGLGAIEVGGTFATSISHLNGASCSTCHMKGTETGKGGHTWKVAASACKSCHNTIVAGDTTYLAKFNTPGKVKDLLVKLANHAKLVNYLEVTTTDNYIGTKHSGYIKPQVNGKNLSATNPMRIPNDIAACIVNFQLVYRDRSLGVHNPMYTISILEKTIAYLDYRRVTELYAGILRHHN